MAAVQAINSSDDPKTLEVIDCRRLLRSLESHRKNIVLQWIPSYCGVVGNDSTDFLAKKGTSIIEIPSRAIPFYSIKKMVTNCIKDHSLMDLSKRVSDKPWRDLVAKSYIGSRRRAVAEFRLATGRDCLPSQN
ncbi:uncharacterized protein [Parasteatoda tepidariorum]|uniref:uncharacterized protein n=1 Tax=Parasteatoda tepidariorum TaxID=114398 RepID=UPI001C729C8E|nr:uncharacterized protein LOC107439407 [Parasteatoda tepidariorum]